MDLLEQMRKQSGNPGAAYDHSVTTETSSVDREAELKDMSRGDLNDLASKLGVDNPASFANKSGVISAIMDAESDGNDSGVEDTELDEDEVEDILNDTEDDDDPSQ